MPPLPGDDQTGTASVLRGRVAHSPRSLYRAGYGRIDLMEETDVRAAIDLTGESGELPEAAKIARHLGIPTTDLHQYFRENPDVHSYYKSARAVVRDRRRAEFQRQVDDAVREGRFVEYREPMNLGRKVTEIDIAKNPRYHRD